MLFFSNQFYEIARRLGKAHLTSSARLLAPFRRSQSPFPRTFLNPTSSDRHFRHSYSVRTHWHHPLTLSSIKVL